MTSKCVCSEELRSATGRYSFGTTEEKRVLRTEIYFFFFFFYTEFVLGMVSFIFYVGVVFEEEEKTSQVLKGSGRYCSPIKRRELRCEVRELNVLG